MLLPKHTSLKKPLLGLRRKFSLTFFANYCKYFKVCVFRETALCVFVVALSPLYGWGDRGEK